MSNESWEPVHIKRFSAWQKQVLVQETRANTLKLNQTSRILPHSCPVCQVNQQHWSKITMPFSSSEVWCSPVQGNKAVNLVLSTFLRGCFGRYMYVWQSNWVLLPKRAVPPLSSNQADVFLLSPCLRYSDCVAAGWCWVSLMTWWRNSFFSSLSSPPLCELTQELLWQHSGLIWRKGDIRNEQQGKGRKRRNETDFQWQLAIKWVNYDVKQYLVLLAAINILGSTDTLATLPLSW